MNQITFIPSTGSVVRPVTLRQAAKLVTEKRLIASARALLLERGYEATTVRDVAAAADRSIGSVFNCFSDKLDLLVAVMVEEGAALADAARGAIAGSPDFVDTIHRLHDLIIQPDCARLILIERSIPPSRRALEPTLYTVIMEAAADAQAHGEIAPHLQLDLICGLIRDLLSARCEDALESEYDPFAAFAINCDRIDLLMTAITP